MSPIKLLAIVKLKSKTRRRDICAGSIARRQHSLSGAAWCVLMICSMCSIGCGAGHQASPTATAVSIILQPADTTVPLGTPGYFKVVAAGSDHLSYQWEKNDQIISDATDSTYSTPPAVLSDSGAKYTVVVSDGTKSITSGPATLVGGPRSPKAGDLRFQQVDSSSVLQIGSGVLRYFLYPFGTRLYSAGGSPIRMGTGVCSSAPQMCEWAFWNYPVQADSSLNVVYFPDLPSELDNDLKRFSTPQSVVTSLDIESGNDIYGMSLLEGAATGFDYEHETATKDTLPLLVAEDGAKG